MREIRQSVHREVTVNYVVFSFFVLCKFPSLFNKVLFGQCLQFCFVLFFLNFARAEKGHFKPLFHGALNRNCTSGGSCGGGGINHNEKTEFSSKRKAKFSKSRLKIPGYLSSSGAFFLVLL